MIASRLSALACLLQGDELSRERVISGDTVCCALISRCVDIDPQELTERGREILGISERIASKAAVTDRDVEVAVRAEMEIAAVMIDKGVVELEKNTRAVRVSLVRVVG